MSGSQPSKREDSLKWWIALISAAITPLIVAGGTYYAAIESPKHRVKREQAAEAYGRYVDSLMLAASSPRRDGLQQEVIVAKTLVLLYGDDKVISSLADLEIAIYSDENINVILCKEKYLLHLIDNMREHVGQTEKIDEMKAHAVLCAQTDYLMEKRH